MTNHRLGPAAKQSRFRTFARSLELKSLLSQHSLGAIVSNSNCRCFGSAISIGAVQLNWGMDQGQSDAYLIKFV